MKIQQFFTARELAEIAKEAGDRVRFPKSERGVGRKASLERWNNQPSNLARKRPGRGGATEYDSSLLPQDMQIEIQRRDWCARQLIKRPQAVEAVNVPNLSPTARQAKVRDARSALLLAIEDYQIRTGTTRSKAISAFLRAVDEWIGIDGNSAANVSQNVCAKCGAHRVPASVLLTDAFRVLPELLKLSNDRPRGSIRIGRSTLYQWFKVRDARGVEALAPYPTKRGERQ